MINNILTEVLVIVVIPLFAFRHKLPLHTCIELELKEAGFFESSDYLQDLIYDNIQILSEDEIGIVVDIRKREDFLEHICAGLQRAERERDRGKRLNLP